ncbi:uncharacterized protein LOC116593459 [Mustela erminea]|uniref:uncharacterized protein LOC116593459 n=1 Tax=Mustela erminea TaxID=36723 RepID=UPI0013871C57|nr:uncharacterized protein LOC116593459 [Mustela erminea]
MAVRGALGEEWDSEEVEECGMGAEGPDPAGFWDQLEEERERGAGRRDKANRLPSPPPGRTAPVLLCEERRLETPEAPAWGSRRGPPRLRGRPPSRLCPAPFSTQILPPEAPPTLPPGLRLRLAPRGPRLLLPTSRPPLVSFTFDFTLESPRDPRATAGRQPRGVAGGRPGRRSWKRIDTAEDTVARAAAAWLRLARTQPQRCACQALPGVSPVSWRDFWGPGEEEQVWRGLQPHLPPTPTRPCIHAHTDWMEGVQPDKLWCRRMACVDELWVLKLRDQRGQRAACHTSAWLGPLLAGRRAPWDHDEHYCSAPCCTATTMLGKQTCRGRTNPAPRPSALRGKHLTGELSRTLARNRISWMSGSGLKSRYGGLGLSETQLHLFLISRKKICVDTDEMMNIYYTYFARHDRHIFVP